MGPSEKTVDRVFVAALKEFKANLLVTSSVATAQTSPMNITYRDLIVNFEKVGGFVFSFLLLRIILFFVFRVVYVVNLRYF